MKISTGDVDQPEQNGYGPSKVDTRFTPRGDPLGREVSLDVSYDEQDIMKVCLDRRSHS